MRIAVFGTGGVGGYFGGRLAQAGEEVIFIARGEHLRAMQANGLRVDSIEGDFVIQPVQATDDTSRVGKVDIILVAVKAWQVMEAAPVMKPMLGEETGVIWLGNGVDAPAQLAAELGAEHVLGGLTQISAVIAAPGHIRHVGIEPLIAFGEMDGRPSQRVDALRQAFERAGVKVVTPADIQAAMWEKFVFIASISGVGAVTRAPAGVLRSVPETRQMLQRAIAEVTQVARARKINLPEDIIAKTLAFIDGMAPGVLASMQRSIMEGRPSELGAQNGAVVRMGLEVGVPTPVHEFIYASLLPQELKARGEIQF
ncbi:MAG: 2-dehydropantoate 2-reductase [Anaerolineales bacterium]|nr:2-dehydropantoate 2-reductase [Anaerolineales bacterium]